MAVHGYQGSDDSACGVKAVLLAQRVWLGLDSSSGGSHGGAWVLTSSDVGTCIMMAVMMVHV
eukprot:2143625-Lingulodinium_polyedra.AAC.1